MARFPRTAPRRTFRRAFSSVVTFGPSPFLKVAAALSLWSAAGAAQSPERSLLRQLVGDVAVEVRTRTPGALVLGATDGRTSLVINLLATDVRRWADSATRILAAPAPRRGQSARWEAVLAGPGVAAGSVSLARRIAPGDTAIVLLVTDAEFRAVRTRLTAEDARALALAMKRAAVAAQSPPARGRPPR